MIIIIGLGNPGQQYKNTRHNVGFMAVDEFARKNNFPEFRLDKKSNSLISENEDVLLAKPQTFMNNSGKAVQQLIKQAKDAQLLVVHDDIDLPVGKIKIIKERGSAGHKGVESIITSIGNDDLARLRIGIGGKKNVEAMSVVLKNFSAEEQRTLDQIISKITDALDLFVKEGLDRAMNEYNK